MNIALTTTGPGVKSVTRSYRQEKPVVKPASKNVTKLPKSMLKTLKRCLAADIGDFMKAGAAVPVDTYQMTKDGPLFFKDNGAKILAVAHLDTVLDGVPDFQGDLVLNCPQLDDRLGLWTIGHLLPSLGCPNYDILLTDGEECGRSTAKHFGSKYPKEYNWIFEFDRAGMDVVMYDYEDIECRDLLEGYGFDVGWGSFTDICSLEHLGVKAFNFGVGYHHQHSWNCYADLEETMLMAQAFVEFAKDMQDVKLPHVPDKKWSKRTSYSWPDGKFYDDDRTIYDDTPNIKDPYAECLCGCELEAWFSYCPSCGMNLMELEQDRMDEEHSNKLPWWAS